MSVARSRERIPSGRLWSEWSRARMPESMLRPAHRCRSSRQSHGTRRRSIALMTLPFRVRAFLLLVTACSTEIDRPPQIDQSNACPGSIELALVSPQLGTVVWTPSCCVAGLHVQRQRDPFSWDNVWFLQPHSTLIFPSVTYAVVPHGAIATLNPIPPPLESGRVYRAIVV